MTGVHRSASPASRRPMSRMMAALCAGSAVMFTAAVVQGSALLMGGDEIVAGPQSDGIVTRPSPETAVAQQDGALRTAGDDARPVIALQSEETGAGPSPMRTTAATVPATSDTTTDDQPVQSRSAPTEWEASLQDALAQQAPAPGEPAPTTAAQPPPAADDVDQSDDVVIVNLMGHLDTGS